MSEENHRLAKKANFFCPSGINPARLCTTNLFRMTAEAIHSFNHELYSPKDTMSQTSWSLSPPIAQPSCASRERSASKEVKGDPRQAVCQRNQKKPPNWILRDAKSLTRPSAGRLAFASLEKNHESVNVIIPPRNRTWTIRRCFHRKLFFEHFRRTSPKLESHAGIWLPGNCFLRGSIGFHKLPFGTIVVQEAFVHLRIYCVFGLAFLTMSCSPQFGNVGGMVEDSVPESRTCISRTRGNHELSVTHHLHVFAGLFSFTFFTIERDDRQIRKRSQPFANIEAKT